MDKEVVERLLENGRNRRKSKEHISCQVQITYRRKYSKEYIETTNRNLKRHAEEGTLPPEVLPELITPYTEDMEFSYAIIPPGRISQRGYVNETWIECGLIESIKINNWSYNIIDPFYHNTKRRIDGFILNTNNLLTLLPSPKKLVVKYFRESR